jgi:hypothetical protein
MTTRERHTVAVYMNVKNCAELLATCLPRLLWADEIVIADVSTNDEIEQLCREKFPQARYFRSKIDDIFGRLAALVPEIRSDFILMVDSDEFYTEAQAEEILEALRKPCDYDGFYVPQVVYSYGASWGPGAAWMRLFRRDRHSLPLTGSAHLMPTVPGKTRTLKNPYDHIPNPKLGMLVVKHFRYEAITASRLSEDELQCRSLHDLRGIRLVFHALKSLARINVRFLRGFFGMRRHGFAGLCESYGAIFRAVAEDVCPTEEWRMRRGLVERGNRGYL